MTQKTIKTRIINKHAIESDWIKAVNFTPLKGELIIYDIEIDANDNTLALPSDRTTPYTYERFKIGDGITNVNSLPFADDALRTFINTNFASKEYVQQYVQQYVNEAILGGEW